MTLHRLLLLFGSLLATLATGCASAQPDPESFMYFIDRTDYAGGDNGFAVPIATCDTGTVFATFTSGHRIETTTLDKLDKVDTGEGPLPLWSLPAIPMSRQTDWPSGHKPHLACYPIEVPTIPLFIDDIPLGNLQNARLEGHEQPTYRDGKHFPIIVWERCELQTANMRGPLRFDPEATHSHHGDSGLPRFVILPDDSLAFLTMEIFRSGGGANHRIYQQLLADAKKKDPSVNWKTVRWTDPAASSE